MFNEAQILECFKMPIMEPGNRLYFAEFRAELRLTNPGLFYWPLANSSEQKIWARKSGVLEIDSRV